MMTADRKQGGGHQIDTTRRKTIAESDTGGTRQWVAEYDPRLDLWGVRKGDLVHYLHRHAGRTEAQALADRWTRLRDGVPPAGIVTVHSGGRAITVRCDGRQARRIARQWDRLPGALALRRHGDGDEGWTVTFQGRARDVHRARAIFGGLS